MFLPSAVLPAVAAAVVAALKRPLSLLSSDVIGPRTAGAFFFDIDFFVPMRRKAMSAKLLTVMLAVYLLLGPALIQVFGFDAPQVRSWEMYGTVGIGAPYGSLRVEHDGQVLQMIDLRSGLGLERTRDLQLYEWAGSLKSDFDAQRAIMDLASQFCNSSGPDATLSISGRIAEYPRWTEFELHHDQLCASR